MSEITIDGVTTNYEIFGEGKPFLILHGWGSNCERWAPVAELISQGKPGGAGPFKVVVVDLPGFGKSSTLPMPWDTNKYINWIEQFIKEIGLSDFYILGHSFGGALASKITVKHAQDVKKVFLVSAACVRTKTTQKSFLKRIAKVVKILHFLPYYSFFRKAVYKFIICKSDYVYVDGVMKQTYLNVIGEDLSFHLPFIKVPTVIIWGSKDESTPIEDAHLINSKIKDSKLVIINDAGHDLNRKQPEILAEKVLENV